MGTITHANRLATATIGGKHLPPLGPADHTAQTGFIACIIALSLFPQQNLFAVLHLLGSWVPAARVGRKEPIGIHVLIFFFAVQLSGFVDKTLVRKPPRLSKGITDKVQVAVACRLGCQVLDGSTRAV